ncbi:F-box protein SKIP14-like [Wolffia australiana]
MTLDYSSRTIFPAGSLPPGLPPDGGGFIPCSFREEDLIWEFFTAPGDGWKREKSGGIATTAVKEEALMYASELLPPPCPTSPACDDIVDLLPADPFGMGLAADSDTWTAAIAGWIEDLAATIVDDFGYYEYGEIYPFGDNLFNNLVFTNSGNSAISSVPCSSEIEKGKTDKLEMQGDLVNSENCCHDALIFALSYLDTADLLSVERVCKTLRQAVRGDPLLWRHIHVRPPLSKNMTDAILLRLTGRASGSLECLSLAECSQVTDAGLRSVLENNPKLRKLNVPACMRLSIGGIVDGLKQFNGCSSWLSSLGIGGLYGITHEHLQALTGLVSPDETQLQRPRKPLFYHRRRQISCHDIPAVDVEQCPRCGHVRVVYDCPVSECRSTGPGPCRACSICIARCDLCGKCIHGHDYEETFSLDCVCLSCMDVHAPPSQELSMG